jgi:quinolinate synthase
MKSINLSNALAILKGNSSDGEIVELPADVAQRATRAMNNMYRLVEC